MVCQQCEEGNHDMCNMATWCTCDCDGPDGTYLPDEGPVFTHCNVCGRKLHTADEDQMGMCEVCGNL